LEETRRIIPGATWTAAGIGREQSRVMQWALERGAEAVRTGMGDNIRIAKDRLTSGNDELVRIAASLLGKHGCRPATPAEARSSLKLRATESSQF
jgi:3-keto-5-aminohexanoate cleavage enzyme